jgi:hypothetical protein
VKVDGKEVTETLTGAELRQRQMNARKFTQSMQQVRDIERGLQQERQSIGQLRRQAEEQRAILTDRARLASYIQQQFPGTTLAEANALAAHTQAQPGYQPQAVPARPQGQAPYAPPQPGIDPDALASVGDIQTIVAQKEAELGRKLSEVEQKYAAIEAGMENLVHTTLNKLATAHEVSKFDQQISQSVTSLVERMPALKAIPDLEDLLRFRVTLKAPNSPEEMFHFLEAEAGAIYEGLRETFMQQQNAVAAAKARMVATGAEPPAGTPPTFQRKISHRGPDGKFDWGQLTADARARAGVL